MPRSRPVDGFSLEYDRAGSGPAVVLLHGWPGSRDDQRDVAALLAGQADVVVPDLRGFGGSDRHAREPAEAYSADAQADSVCALIEELELERPVLSGDDVGSRVAQTIAARLPDDVRALVVAPPMPGVGRRVLEPDSQREFWYQPFHRLPLSERLVAGDARAGAFTASIGWYRAGAVTFARSLAEQAPAPLDRVAVPTTVLWPEH